MARQVNNFAFGGIFSWELDLWGRVRRSNEAALAEMLASEEVKRGVMLTVVSDAASGYVVCLAWAQRDGGCEALTCNFGGNRAEVREQAARIALSGALKRVMAATLMA